MAQAIWPASTAHSSDLRGSYLTTELQDYLLKNLIHEPAALAQIRRRSVKRGLPPWSIGPMEGKILEFLTRSVNAKKAVEIGTLGGYSAAWIALGLGSKGRLWSLERDDRFAREARENLKRAGLQSKVEIVVDDALPALSRLSSQGPFDLCFIDADKINYARYGQWAAKNVRSGGLIIADNAYLFGKLHLPPALAEEEGPAVPSMRGLLKLLADKKYFSSCSMIPTGEGLAVGVRK
ncbi:MAG: O-methyltransferase [Elusimicrobia bacterium]|nr:O-methyltransferase [Elusimicrobiota bacterium]